MILDRLTLHNFCLYKGQQDLDLAPESRNRPVVLVGGLNGGGKTTILDAVQLTLYGNRAQVSEREGITYEKFLGNCINRGVDPTDGASVGLQFRYVSEGEQKLYEVRRSWSLKKSNVRESVTVHCDGKPDRHLSDHWNDIVEELIPLGISRLFFFDAEQASRMIKMAVRIQETMSEYLKQATQNRAFVERGWRCVSILASKAIVDPTSGNRPGDFPDHALRHERRSAS